MKKTDKIATTQKSEAELNQELKKLQKDLFESRVKHSMASTKDTSVFKKIKYQIAFIKTLLNKKHDN